MSHTSYLVDKLVSLNIFTVYLCASGQLHQTTTSSRHSLNSQHLRDIVGLQLLSDKLMSPLVFHLNRMYTSLIDGPRMPDRKNSRKEGTYQVWQYMPIISILGR